MLHDYCSVLCTAERISAKDYRVRAVAASPELLCIAKAGAFMAFYVRLGSRYADSQWLDRIHEHQHVWA